MAGRTIGFIGAGNMARAIIKGIVSARPRLVGKVHAFDISSERLKEIAREYGVAAASSNADVCRKAGVVVLAVKPQQMDAVLREIAPALEPGKLVVSIAAGVTLRAIEAKLGRKARLVRVMPNTPLLVGMGMSAVAAGERVREEDRRFVLDLFGSVGKVIEVDEKLMDAVTALSGSGPAFVFSFIEGLADGGVKAGLPRKEAVLLAAQTVAGAAQMVLSTGMHTGQLRDMVASPGGTTIHGLHVLEGGGLSGLVMAAVEAAWKRAGEIAGERA